MQQPLFIDEPRYRRSGARVPTAYIVATRAERGIAAGPVAQVYLNDYGSKALNPERVALVARLLETLNSQAGE